jgi:hypothetical protein
LGSIVITTIQAPTDSVRAMLESGRRAGLGTIAIGDRKTPAADWPEPARFVGIDAQAKLGFSLAALLPENHYSRKNLGYLLAMAGGAPLIFDTDDDNAPLASWARRELEVQAESCAHRGWVNAYRWFSDEHVWPRGLPLESIAAGAQSPPLAPARTVRAPIQQGLADGSPDVDAIWRLLLDRDIRFRERGSILLEPGAWCPFNSQSTWWFPEAYPLMYLPSLVSFRMTDIWRSFVAQRCLWAMGAGVVFHSAEMFQDRNPHNLLRDFEQEIPGYLGNERIRVLLDALELEAGADAAGRNCLRCYEALVQAGIVPAGELPLLRAWLADVASPSAIATTSLERAS